MNTARPMIVAYDISIRKIRNRALKIVREYRLGGQKSVHECRLSNRQAEELYVRLAEPLDLKTDSLLMVWLEPHRKALSRGTGRSDIETELWHIG